jgi:NhaP-type Na+/H+ or K+/H+ antiporter
MKPETIIAALSVLIIASYVFNLLSRWTRIPSVFLLLGVGVAARQFFSPDAALPEYLNHLVQLFGVAGLVMIVLEASLDLKASPGKMSLMRNAFFSATMVLAASTTFVSTILHFWLECTWRLSVVYAIPLSIISSAIVIPSAEHLPETKREFVVYESSFSDILGILVFDFFVLNDTVGVGSVVGFFGSTVLVTIGSVLASIAMLWLVGNTTTIVKFFLLLAVLFFLYSAGKLVHLPSLLLVLIFGLVLNNLDVVIRPRNARFFDKERLNDVVTQFKAFTAELSFFIRTFFFLLFGFSVDIQSLASSHVFLLGATIVLALLTVRFFYFRYSFKSSILPEVLLMPRGLITVLLFYSIPAQLTLSEFDPGIVLFVIIATTLLMTLGLVMYKIPKSESDEIQIDL